VALVLADHSIGRNQSLTGQASKSFSNPSFRSRVVRFNRYSPASNTLDLELVTGFNAVAPAKFDREHNSTAAGNASAHASALRSADFASRLIV